MLPITGYNLLGSELGSSNINNPKEVSMNNFSLKIGIIKVPEYKNKYPIFWAPSKFDRLEKILSLTKIEVIFPFIFTSNLSSYLIFIKLLSFL